MPPSAVSTFNTRFNRTGSWRSIKPLIDYSKCTSCMICWKFCPEPAILIKDGKVLIDYDFCKGCGICCEVCPKKAISMQREKK